MFIPEPQASDGPWRSAAFALHGVFFSPRDMEAAMITDQAILKHIEHQPHYSAGYKQLVREMRLRGADRHLLEARLQALVKSGRLVETGRDRYTLAEHAAARQNLIAGRLTMHRDGYGFVIPNAAQRSTIEGDVYIGPQAIGSACTATRCSLSWAVARRTGGLKAEFSACLLGRNLPSLGSFIMAHDSTS